MLGRVAEYMSTDQTRKNYTYEQKLGSVEDHLSKGMTATDAMRAHGVLSESAFFRWCSTYRAEGAEALRPKKRGRPIGSRSSKKR